MLYVGWSLVAGIHGGPLQLGLVGGTTHLEVGPSTQVGSLDVLRVKPWGWLQEYKHNTVNALQ